MLAAFTRSSALRCGVRSFSAAAAPAAAAAAPVAAVDAEHKSWISAVQKYPIVIPRFEWTLEFALPTPIPMHQFEQSPVVIEVKDRNADPDSLVYMGPNVIGGYTHPVSGKKITRDEHFAMKSKSDAKVAAEEAAHHH